jgi:hypothetical protein
MRLSARRASLWWHTLVGQGPKDGGATEQRDHEKADELPGGGGVPTTKAVWLASRVLERFLHTRGV